MNESKYRWSKLDPDNQRLRKILDNSVDSLSERLLESISSKTSQSQGDHLKYMKDLIDKGADINFRSKDGRVLICEVARSLRSDELKYLISLGGNVNVKDAQGNTPLHTSVYNQSVENILILLNNFAYINSVNIFGNTPLMEAILVKNIQAIKVLLSKDADIDIINTDGLIAIDLALATNDENIINLFKENTKKLGRYKNDKRKNI